MASATESLVSLSQLCALCHTREPRYTCPRCSTRTCSLQCVQKHKARANCNGKRDPAAYLKKRELETPAGVDQDYNFLSGVERAFGRAERIAEGAGILVANGDCAGRRAGGGLSRRVEGAIAASGVHVIRAPKGMSRQKENKTGWNGRGCLNWSVEWVLPGGERTIKTCAEDMSVAELYAGLNDVGGKRGKKRKRGAASAPASTTAAGADAGDFTAAEANAGNVTAAEANAGDVTAAENKDTAERQAEEQITDATPPNPPSAPRAPTNPPSSDSTPQPINPSSTSPLTHATAAPTTAPTTALPQPPSQHQQTITGNPPLTTLTYHLHDPTPPRTTPDLNSARIPIEPTKTLGEVLVGRTVCEFPTIYVEKGDSRS